MLCSTSVIDRTAVIAILGELGSRVAAHLMLALGLAELAVGVAVGRACHIVITARGGA